MRKKIYILFVFCLLAFVGLELGTNINAYSGFEPQGTATKYVTVEYTDANGVRMRTQISRNYDLGPSAYFDVTHTVMGESIFIAGDLLTSRRMLTYLINGEEEVYNSLLTLFFATNLEGTEQLIVNGSVKASIGLNEYTYRAPENETWNGNYDWRYYYLVETSGRWVDVDVQKNPVSITHHYEDSTRELNTGNTYEIDLNEKFLYHDTSYYTIFGSDENGNYRENTVPEIMGLSIQYTIKADHEHANSFEDYMYDYRSLIASFGYYTTYDVNRLEIEPSFDLSCSLSKLRPPFVSCSGPGVSIQNGVSTITNHKGFLVNEFFYNRKMEWDSSVGYVSDITNMKYGYRNSETEDYRYNHFEFNKLSTC